MGKSFSDTVLDQKLLYIQNNGNQMFACSAEPTTYVEASATFRLGLVAMTTPGDYTGPEDYTTGRKITTVQKTMPVDTSGTVTHYAICDSVGSALLAVTTSQTSSAVVIGNDIVVPAFEIRDADPV